jgi:hypothetical protein
MSPMEPTTTSKLASEPTRTDTGETFFKTPNAPPGRHFEQMILPGLGFTFPRWLVGHLRRLFQRTATHR